MSNNLGNTDTVDILIVNQFKETSRFLANILDTKCKGKYNFEIADYIEEGRQKLNSHQDLVICGRGNGWDGNGLDFLDYVVSQGHPAIVMSGYHDQQEAFQRGALGYIPLPFKLKDVPKIEAIIDDALKGKTHPPIQTAVNLKQSPNYGAQEKGNY